MASGNFSSTPKPFVQDFSCKLQGLEFFLSFQVPEVMIYQLPHVPKIAMLNDKMQFAVVFDLRQQFFYPFDLLRGQFDGFLVAGGSCLAIFYLVVHHYASHVPGSKSRYLTDNLLFYLLHVLIISYTISSQFQAPNFLKLSREMSYPNWRDELPRQTLAVRAAQRLRSTLFPKTIAVFGVILVVPSPRSMEGA